VAAGDEVNVDSKKPDRTTSLLASRTAKIGAALAVVLALAAFFAALPEPGDRREPAPAPAFAIRDVRVFDGERMIPRANVVVRGGRVASVGADAPIPAGIEVVDGRGRTLLPGLIDAHVHAYLGGLQDALNFGVTTVLDMFGDPAMLRELKPARESLAPVRHADLFGAGFLATVPGGHGTQFGLPVPTITRAEDADAWVGARIADGSDYIKLVYEPKGPNGLGPPFPSLDAPMMAAVVQAAHARGRLAVAHISRLGPARDALAVGIDGLVHVQADAPPDDTMLALAAERRAFVVPTLAVTAGFTGSDARLRLASDPRIAPYLTPEQRDTLTGEMPARIPVFRTQVPAISVCMLRDAGVEILAGSDAPNPGTAQGATLHEELELLVAAGLPPVEALAAATSRPARRFALPDRGRIAPGVRADLLLVDGDPSADILATRAIVSIWKNGARVERRRYPASP
jgi:imidazolonepropionase-like amidohydrolase